MDSSEQQYVLKYFASLVKPLFLKFLPFKFGVLKNSSYLCGTNNKFKTNIVFAGMSYLCTKIKNYANKQECTHTL